MSIVRYFIVFVLGFAPVSEVRGAVPVARILFSSDTEFILAILLAVLANLLIAPAVLYTLNSLEKFIVRRGGTLGKLYRSALNMARKKSDRVKKYGPLGLMIFVGIPLPATGAWTGTLIAYVLGLPRLASLIAVELGVMIASCIVYTATVLGIEIIKTLFLL